MALSQCSDRLTRWIRKTMGMVSPVEDDHKDEASLAKDQIEQSRQRLVKLEDDGLEFVSSRDEPQTALISGNSLLFLALTGHEHPCRSRSVRTSASLGRRRSLSKENWTLRTRHEIFQGEIRRSNLPIETADVSYRVDLFFVDHSQLGRCSNKRNSSWTARS